ncbi:MAG: MEMO1 family protein [Gemmatimonadales bacterium]|nr:hypothetical protein HRbin33_02574 [bacterium HR33]GIW51361.1 MAG: MEMO1 family protein [Gemmatimonadales bacterium]
MAGRFYPADRNELGDLVDRLLSAARRDPRPAPGGIVPHAALVYSGACAASLFGRVAVPNTVVILAPNHTGRLGAPGGASGWMRGSFATPLGELPVAEDFMTELEASCDLVAHDPWAHEFEHAIEVELPFLQKLNPACRIAPLVLAFDDWGRCETLGGALAQVVARWPEPVLLLASSDMTHYEPAEVAARKDRLALEAVERLDGRRLLGVCRKEGVTMCGRAPAAAVLEAARRLGASRAEVVDYRHSGWVTGDDRSVVGYAAVLIS